MCFHLLLKPFQRADPPGRCKGLVGRALGVNLGTQWHQRDVLVSNHTLNPGPNGGFECNAGIIPGQNQASLS